MTRRRTTTAALAAVTLLVLAGCGDESTDKDSSGSPSVSPTTTAPTSPAPKTPEELAAEALTSYLTIAETAEKSGKVADLTKLTAFAVGDAVFDQRKKVMDYQANGVRLRGTVGHELGEAVSADPGTLVIPDCEDRSQAKVVVLSSGNEVSRTDPEGNPMADRVRNDYTVVKRSEGEWVVESVNVLWGERC